MNKCTLKIYGLEMTNVSYAHVSKNVFTQNFKTLCKSKTNHSKHVLKPAGVVVESHGLPQGSQPPVAPGPGAHFWNLLIPRYSVSSRLKAPPRATLDHL